MNVVVALIIVVLQFVAGYILGPVLAIVAGVGDGWELAVIGIGNVSGVWVVGVLAARFRSKESAPGKFRYEAEAVNEIIISTIEEGFRR